MEQAGRAFMNELEAHFHQDRYFNQDHSLQEESNYESSAL